MRSILLVAVFSISTAAFASTKVPNVQCTVKEASGTLTVGIDSGEVMTFDTVKVPHSSVEKSDNFKTLQDASEALTADCRANLKKYGNGAVQTFGFFSRNDNAYGNVSVEFVSGHFDQNCNAEPDFRDNLSFLPQTNSPYSDVVWDSQAACVRNNLTK